MPRSWSASSTARGISPCITSWWICSRNRCLTIAAGALPGRKPGSRASLRVALGDAIDLGVDDVARDLDGEGLLRFADVGEFCFHGRLRATVGLQASEPERRGVRKEGLEPTHPFGYQILSLARLPVPPLSRVNGHRQRTPEARLGERGARARSMTGRGRASRPRTLVTSTSSTGPREAARESIDSRAASRGPVDEVMVTNVRGREALPRPVMLRARAPLSPRRASGVTLTGGRSHAKVAELADAPDLGSGT